MKRYLSAALALAALVAAGAFAALTTAPSAHAYGLPDLAGLGYDVSLVVVAGTPTCSNYYASGNGAPSTLVASTGPDCPGTLQGAIDALVAAFPPASQQTTTAPTTTPPPDTTPTTTPTTTTAPPPDTTAAAIDALTAQVNALTQQIGALTTRVDRLEHAGDAASLAFDQALEQGMTVADAAALARGTWLNAVNGLGDFA